jgi:putative polyhydroxyalkanoate system protein
MPDIQVARRHALPMPKARALAERAIDDLAARYGASTEWRGDVLCFHAAGAEGQVRLSGSEIRVDVKLGLLLRPFKAKFAARIERHLDELLARRERRPAPAGKRTQSRRT